MKLVAVVKVMRYMCEQWYIFVVGGGDKTDRCYSERRCCYG